MKKLKANSVDLKKMKNIRGGDVIITNVPTVKVTKKQQMLANEVVYIEVSGTITVEK